MNLNLFDQSINHVKRQYSKSDLASLVEDAATNSCESVRRHASQQRMSLTSKDVLQLLYPTPQVDERVDVSFSRSDDDDDVKEQSSSQQVLDHILQQTMSELGREVRKVTCTYQPTYLSTYLPTNLPTHLPTYLSIYLPTYLSTYLPTYLHTYLPTYQSITSTYLPTYQSIYLSIYLPINLSPLPTYLST